MVRVGSRQFELWRWAVLAIAVDVRRPHPCVQRRNPVLGAAGTALSHCSAQEHFQVLEPMDGMGPLAPIEVAVYRSRESRGNKTAFTVC